MSQFESIEKVLSLPRPELIASAENSPSEDLLKRHKISSDEYKKVLAVMGRHPSMAELGVFSAMWSEHCSYKSSRVHLKRFPTTGERVVVGPGENAGVVRLKGKVCVAFKMESHNHPSYIEPYQGAATGVGGILRDVFCMGARPIANLNCLRFGERGHARTPYLVPRVVKGIGDYGNCVGIPTVGGSVSYDKSYNGNCLVNAMSVGLIDEDKIFKGLASGLGNLIVYVGSATGRDGIHGATMASDEFASAKAQSKTTVQVGDPFAEKLLMEATLEVLAKNLVVGIQDMGAAGLTSSSFEMAGRAGNGIYINLDLVPTRADKMSAYEIMLSESQERMLMVVEPAKYKDLEQVLRHWGLKYAAIGVVTDTGRVHAVRDGKLEIDIPVAPLTDEAPVYNKPVASGRVNQPELPLKELWKKLSEDRELARQWTQKVVMDNGSKQKIFEQFDRHIGNRTVLGPDHGGAAVMWIHEASVEGSPKMGIAISAGCDERKVKNSPRRGAAESVAARAREIAAAGGKPLAITDCLNFGSADDPLVMWEFSQSVDGIADACRELGAPVVSGNVSLYNTTAGVSIHPTPMIGMVGEVSDIGACTPAILESVSATTGLYLLEPADIELNSTDLAASLIAKAAEISVESGEIAAIDWSLEKAAMAQIDRWRKDGVFRACRSLGDGGLFLGAVKFTSVSLMKKRSLDLSCVAAPELFAERGGRYLIALSDGKASEDLVVSDERLRVRKIGRILSDDQGVCLTSFGQLPVPELLTSFEASNEI